MDFNAFPDIFKNDLAKNELKIANKSVLSEPFAFLVSGNAVLSGETPPWPRSLVR